jgi:RNase H-fold protein (predicted Holliday junction resolvase)
MYKTISIHNHTYQQLNAIAAKLDKPKAQVIDELVKGYIEQMNETEKKDLQAFNAFVAKLGERIKLPEGTTINTEEMDTDFAVINQSDI